MRTATPVWNASAVTVVDRVSGVDKVGQTRPTPLLRQYGEDDFRRRTTASDMPDRIGDHDTTQVLGNGTQVLRAYERRGGRDSTIESAGFRIRNRAKD